MAVYGPRRPAQSPAVPGQEAVPAPSAIGTRRRLMALAARGGSPQAIQAETGIPAQLIRRELDGRPNQAPGLPKVIASAYDRLWNRDPPTAVPAQRQAAVAAAAE